MQTIQSQESAIEFARTSGEAQSRSQKEERLKYLTILIELTIWLNEMPSPDKETRNKQTELLELLRKEIAEDNPLLFSDLENRLGNLRLA